MGFQINALGTYKSTPQVDNSWFMGILWAHLGAIGCIGLMTVRCSHLSWFLARLFLVRGITIEEVCVQGVEEVHRVHFVEELH